MRRRDTRRLGWMGLVAALWLAGCGQEAPPEAASAAATAEAEAADDRMQRLEARLAETEARLLRAEARAALAEGQVRALKASTGEAPAAEPDPTVELRTEDEIKAAATGVDDGAGGPAALQLAEGSEPAPTVAPED